MSEQTKRIFEIRAITNEVSPTFCLAKWHHTTINLHMGQTHSCYHPPPHDIPLDELRTNPSALHNTSRKKAEREQMLNGQKPDGCKYCWNVESLGPTHISDRHIRNASIMTKDRFHEIRNNSWDYNVRPEYIEVAFSSECNFKCGYCHPRHSTSFFNEIKNHGPYSMVKNHRSDIDWFKIYEEDTNPYVDAWWKWWPDVSKTLNILRITGGEPLMHRSTWHLFDLLRAEPLPQLELNINSNLGVKSAMVERLVENVNDVVSNGKIRKFKLFTSLDTWGARAEYLRTGLKLDLWEQNMDTYLVGTGADLTFMCTFNILTVTSFTDFLAKVLEWREKYNTPEHNKIRFDTPYLKEPLQYDMHILPKAEFLPYFDSTLEFIKQNLDDADNTKFTTLEYEKFRRVRDYFATEQYSEERVAEGRRDFHNWFDEYDRRRGVSLLNTFPEMTNFYNLCKTS